ncbi:MAG: hypothetical protein Q7W45_07930 [Bacteroidota bacterium]|nr:hypothetical protein [Bacteroidota bacterium]MDP3145977.1 hypothetical protein [Bacteroidota bacterium]
MVRDKARDNKYFNCSQESEMNYVSALYHQNTIVKDFLKYVCVKGILKNSLYMDVYDFIKKELGYELPN